MKCGSKMLNACHQPFDFSLRIGNLN